MQADGRPLFILERKVGGRKFHISTRAHTEKAAYAHLRRFEADPWKYAEEMAHGRSEVAQLHLSAELVAEYRRWMLTRSRPAPVSLNHANDMTRALGDWAEDLKGRDLKRLDLPFLKERIAKRRTAERHRIIAIKGFFTWLREERHLIDRRDDPTLDLKVPQAIPEKHRRRKAVRIEDVQAVIAALQPAYRDCLLLLARTGWHVSELARFARDPDSRIAPGNDTGVLAVLQVRHKSGDTSRTPIMEPEALAAAQRIRERRTMPRKMNDTIKAACVAAGVPVFHWGVLRHSVATWAIEAGTPADVVAEFLGHKDKKTTLRFYADVGVPTLPVRLPKL